MTRFIAAYDTENAGTCLSTCGPIKDAPTEFDFSATFFIVGKRLEEEGMEYRNLLGDVPAFEIASHTYSHRILRDHPFCGSGPDNASRLQELQLGKELVEQTFGRSCVGLRPECGFAEGLRGDDWLLSHVETTGFKYVSSVLWGPGTAVPALLAGPSTYERTGFPICGNFRDMAGMRIC